MAAKPIVTPNLIPDTQQTVSETGKPNWRACSNAWKKCCAKLLGTMRTQSGTLSVGFEPLRKRSAGSRKRTRPASNYRQGKLYAPQSRLDI